MSNGESTALAPINSAPRIVSFRNLDDIERFAKLVCDSALVPKDYRGKLPDVIGVIMFGAELGLNAMAALQNIAWINGRPSVWGDFALALIEASGLLEAFEEIEPEECQRTGIGRCTLKRRGKPPITRTYSKEMATTAKLWGKAGPWSEHSGRMLQMRARGWALRDAFSDVLKGLYTVEEARDIVLTPSPEGTWQAPVVTSDNLDSGLSGTANASQGSPAGVTAAAPEQIADALLDDAAETLHESRDFLQQQISATLTQAYPGNEVAAKRGRTGLLLEAFGVSARRELSALAFHQLQAGYAHLQELVGQPAAEDDDDGVEAAGAPGPSPVVSASSVAEAVDAPPEGPLEAWQTQRWYQLSKRALAAGMPMLRWDQLRSWDDYTAAEQAVEAAEGAQDG